MQVPSDILKKLPSARIDCSEKSPLARFIVTDDRHSAMQAAERRSVDVICMVPSNPSNMCHQVSKFGRIRRLRSDSFRADKSLGVFGHSAHRTHITALGDIHLRTTLGADSSS